MFSGDVARAREAGLSAAFQRDAEERALLTSVHGRDDVSGPANSSALLEFDRLLEAAGEDRRCRREAVEAVEAELADFAEDAPTAELRGLSLGLSNRNGVNTNEKKKPGRPGGRMKTDLNGEVENGLLESDQWMNCDVRADGLRASENDSFLGPLMLLPDAGTDKLSSSGTHTQKPPRVGEDIYVYLGPEAEDRAALFLPGWYLARVQSVEPRVVRIKWANPELEASGLLAEILRDRMGWHPAASFDFPDQLSTTSTSRPVADQVHISRREESRAEAANDAAEFLLDRLRSRLTVTDSTLFEASLFARATEDAAKERREKRVLEDGEDDLLADSPKTKKRKIKISSPKQKNSFKQSLTPYISARDPDFDYAAVAPVLERTYYDEQLFVGQPVLKALSVEPDLGSHKKTSRNPYHQRSKLKNVAKIGKKLDLDALLAASETAGGGGLFFAPDDTEIVPIVPQIVEDIEVEVEKIVEEDTFSTAWFGRNPDFKDVLVPYPYRKTFSRKPLTADERAQLLFALRFWKETRQAPKKNGK